MNTFQTPASVAHGNTGHREQLAYSAFAIAESLRDMSGDPTPYARSARAMCRQHIERIANTLIHYAGADA